MIIITQVAQMPDNRKNISETEPTIFAVLLSLKIYANNFAIDNAAPLQIHIANTGRKITIIIIIPITANEVFVFEAIVKKESTVVESVLPTIGTKEPTAFFIDRFNIVSDECDKKL